MNFSIITIENSKPLYKLKNNLEPFSNEGLTIFHYNELNDKTIHIVFNIKDEYLFGTKLSGHQLNLPMNQYINTFYNKKLSLLFIEHVNESYCMEITNYLSKNKVKSDSVKFNNHTFLSISSHYDGFIKQVDFHDKFDGEDFSKESLSNESLKKMLNENNNWIISYILFLFKNHFISLSDKGKISINNSSLNFLTKFIEEFPYVHNH